MFAPSVDTIVDAFRQMRDDYKIGKPSRFRRIRTGMPATAVQADWHHRQATQFYRDMEIARDIEHNTPIMDMGLRKLAANVLVNGTGIEPDTGDESIDNDLSQEFKETSEETDLDYYDEMTVDDMERTVLRRWIVDGDIWPMWTEEGNVQLVEGHNVRGAQTVNRDNEVLGVQLDGNHRKQGIKIRSIPANIYQTNAAAVEPRSLRDELGRVIEQVFEPRRVAMTRGYTYLNPITDVSEKHEEIQFAKLVQAQTVSCYAVLRQQKYDPKPQVPLNPVNQQGEETPRPGYTIRTSEGETVTGFSPNVPNPEFFEFSNLMLTLLSVNIELPLICLLLDGSMTNFSGFRGALEQARLRFVQIQKLIWRKVRRFTYRRWLLRKIALDRPLELAGNRDGIDLLKCRPILPSWPYLEPLQDTKAKVLQLRSGMTSKRRFHASEGRRHEQVVREQVEDASYEIEAAMTAAEAINKRHPDSEPVHWRQLINLPTPEGAQINLDAADQQKEAENTPSNREIEV